MKMIEMDCLKEFILRVGYTEDEFSEAQNQMVQLAE